MTPSTKHLPDDHCGKSHRCFGSGAGNKCCHSASGNLQLQSCNTGSSIVVVLAAHLGITSQDLGILKKTINQAAKAPKSQCKQGNCNSFWYNGGSIAAALAALLMMVSEYLEHFKNLQSTSGNSTSSKPVHASQHCTRVTAQ